MEFYHGFVDIFSGILFLFGVRGAMQFLLKHYFDPDWDPARLKPEKQADGSVDHHELHFVDNISAGDVIAEWIPLDESDVVDQRFVSDDKVFPAGRGTGVKRDTPDILYAAVDGYACYKDGKIRVRETLTVHRDIDYRTGNISFVGNIAIEGSIRGGFSMHGRDVRVNGPVEGAHIVARNNLDCRGGVKGGRTAHLESGNDMKLAFCEYATLLSKRDVLIKGALMHSEVFAGRRLAVGGRLTGGHICAYDFIYVGEQLGGGMDTDTILVLGYDPALLNADRQFNERIKVVHDNIAFFEKILHKGKEYKAEYEPKLAAAYKELELLKGLKVKLWDGIYATERLDECRVLVPGVVKPGTEISIGSAYLKVDDFLEDVFFYYENYEVKIGASAGKMKR